LLTLLDTSGDFIQSTDNLGDFVPLSSRLRDKDGDLLGLHYIHGCVPGCNIFQNFLESGHPLALDGQRYTTAALACLKIIFKHYHYQIPHSHLKWFSQHYRHPKVAQKYLSHQRHTGHPAGRGWNQFFSPVTSIVSDSPMSHFPNLTQHLRTCVSNQIPRGRWGGHSGIGRPINSEFDYYFRRANHYQRLRSKHLQSLLQKSAYSNDLLDFACQRVFRFGYLQRSHPPYIKKAISALAKYVYRVTGRTAELKACESLWGRAKWFTAQ